MDDVQKDLVSIVLPAYNGAPYLPRAVASALSQTHEAVEVIIVDDGSTDGTAEVADELQRADPRVRTVHQENGGTSRARNTALRLARGEFISFLDQDDEYLPHKTAMQVEALRDNPEYSAVYSQFDRVSKDDGRVYPANKGETPLPFAELLTYRNWFVPVVPLLRRTLVEQVGLFDESIRGAEDYDYWLRCARAGRFLYVPGVVARYHLHDAQASRNAKMMANAQRQLIAKHFAHDAKARRHFLSYLHLANARVAKGAGDWPAVAWRLLLFLLNARTPREARFVWDLSQLG